MGTIQRATVFSLDGFALQTNDRIIMTLPGGRLVRGQIIIQPVGQNVEAHFQGPDGHIVPIHSGTPAVRDNSITSAIQATTDHSNNGSFDTLDGKPIQDGEALLVSFPDGSLVQGKVTVRTETTQPGHTYTRSYFAKEDGVLVSLHREGVTAKRGS